MDHFCCPKLNAPKCNMENAKCSKRSAFNGESEFIFKYFTK